MSRAEKLVAIDEDGLIYEIDNTYEAIKAAVRDATIDAVRVDDDVAFYIDDNGMLTGERLNVAASMFAARPVYGPVVMMGAEPDGEGENQPAPHQAILAMQVFAQQWRGVMRELQRMNQPRYIKADPDNVPAPEIVAFSTPEEFDAWLMGGGR